MPPVVWEGEHLRYRTDEDPDSICTGTFDYLDYRVGHLVEVFDLPKNVIVDYSWTPGDSLAEHCSSSLGCSAVDGRRAFSRWIVHEHELTHAVRAPPSQRALEEGIAVAFGENRALPGEVDGDVEGMLRDADPKDASSVADSSFPRLGHFVSYIAAEYGLETLAQLSRLSSIEDGYTQLAADFEAAAGVPLASALDDYDAAYPICDTPRYRYDGVECSHDPIPGPTNVGDQIDVVVPIGCSDPDTIGPQQGKIWKTLAIDVASDGRHLWSLLPVDGLRADVSLSECGASCFDLDTAYYFEADGVLGVTPCLRRGVYLVRVAVDADTHGEFHFSMERVGSGSCE